MPGFNSKISYDPTNQLTLIIWTNLTVSLDGQQTANTLFVKMLDQIYVLSPLSPRRRRLIEQSRLGTALRLSRRSSRTNDLSLAHTATALPIRFCDVLDFPR